MFTETMIKTKSYKAKLAVLLAVFLFAGNTSVFAQSNLAPVPGIYNKAVGAAEKNNAPVLKGQKVIPGKKELSAPAQTAGNSGSVASTSSGSIDFKVNSGEKPVIKTNEAPKKLDGYLFDNNKEKMQQAFQEQKKKDIDDIKMLWESTVERNTIIKFALKKLAMPAEQRRVHSSLMAKSVSALISGAAILPNIFGLDTFTSTASLAGGSLANRIIENKTLPKDIPLTDTELIQLANLIEDLQDRIIQNYYDYKSSLEALKICRQNLIVQNRNYSEALKEGNSISIIAASSLYDKEVLNEAKLKQQIKLTRIELERLAGPDAVTGLTLSRMANYGVNGNTAENKSQNSAPQEAVK